MRINLSAAKELQQGEMKEYSAEGKSFLVARLADNLFAVSPRCPHLGCRLAEGQLEGRIITCPCHGSQFDVTNGELMRWIPDWPAPIGLVTKSIGWARPLNSYRVEIAGDAINIVL